MLPEVNKLLQQAHLSGGLLRSDLGSSGLHLKSSDLFTNVRWWALLEQLPDFWCQAYQDQVF